MNTYDDDMPRNSRRKSRRPSPLYKANNMGGYGNPPVAHQFQPGNQGGPGRMRGSTSLDSALRKMFASKVPVTKNGRTIEIDMAEAMAERLRQLILGKDLKALLAGLDLMQKFGPRDEKPEVIYAFDFEGMSLKQKRAVRDLFESLTPYDRRELMADIRAYQRKLGRDPKRLKDDSPKL